MPYEIPAPGRRRRPVLVFLIGALLILLLLARSLSSYVIDYQWWREMGQVPTWLSLLFYQLAPLSAATLLAFVVLWLAHRSALRFAGAGPGRSRVYAWITSLVALLVGFLISSSTIDTWTVVRYFGGRNLPAEATAWHDAVFGEPLKFYLFDLPFYRVLLSYVLALAIAAMIVYWLAARIWQLKERFTELQEMTGFDLRLMGLQGGLQSMFLRGGAALLLVAVAVHYYLGRYQMLYNDHNFMVGMDYVDLTWTLPLQWLVIATCLLAAVSASLSRWRWVLLFPAALILKALLPALIVWTYVGPNEISIERPYVQTHIQATRAAFGLDQRVRQTEFKAQLEAKFDPQKNQAILSNVRLWDWRAFHDTVTQRQALRTYYRFWDTDIDRYTIDGQLRQVLVSPRELDIKELPEAARASWPNRHFIYTHGYGMVLAEANRITQDGLPVFFIQDMPPLVKTPSLKFTRPELYYSEITSEPIFVHTEQKEFDYPSGDDNAFSQYQGQGGFPVSSLPMRLAAALAEADANILLTGYLTPSSRMMIHRNVRERLSELAGFLSWDTDPYLVLTDSGRLVWTVDGYTTSDAHPYSRLFDVPGIGEVNYMRNAVKATVDAYDGEVHIYIFDGADPIIRAYQQLFPKLFLPFSEMPADLRRHARYPEGFFRTQAEVYRTFHMQDPQAFYNREDVWDVAQTVRSQSGKPEPMDPNYMVASLPGEDHAEFMLMLPFTPRNKTNLSGLMMARCDGDQLGNTVVLQLSKQQLISGPMQVEANINQDQTISKDLTLWNQQGSTVLRGQMLVLPISNTFLYLEPIYIQASEAPQPQLKKVAVVMGNKVIYTDTYDQALAQLSGFMQGIGLPAGTPPSAAQAAAAPSLPGADPRLESIRQHLRRYNELAGQGRWAEAGKEMDAIESELSRR
ncbi:MAG: UPF0182 family protein [Bryobacteraceae bacterium]